MGKIKREDLIISNLGVRLMAINSRRKIEALNCKTREWTKIEIQWTALIKGERYGSPYQKVQFNCLKARIRNQAKNSFFVIKRVCN